MPLSSNLNAFFGAAVLGVISAAGLYLVEHYRQEKVRHAMAKDLARLDQELSKVKEELDQLLMQKKEKKVKPRRIRHDYLSASNADSSDLEFYDVSDDEPDTDSSSLDIALNQIDKKLEGDFSSDLEKSFRKTGRVTYRVPENAEILWRIGKVHHKLSDKSNDTDFIQEQIAKGVEACTLALKLKPDSSEVHKWYAILIGSRSDFVSLQEKISDGHLFKQHVDEAIALNPTDPTLHHMLGRFKYEIAGLKWYERKVAAALFSEPPNATYPDALLHFLEAEKLANFEWKENKLMIAKCKIAESEYQEAGRVVGKSKSLMIKLTLKSKLS
ncbi:hypothetical protein NQ317_019416 [Molorchus minor]|uniref:Regulator of microtubule dynamics protein 1 n=1 Tax=Molorchus minor TaxID=1323400 RepID=A0ABQ9JFJ3_9CUCU|nr:hypothetical protein NQ317_019416 [Molorchus minor]